MQNKYIMRHNLSLCIIVTAIILLVLQALLGTPVSAEEVKNSYGSPIIYKPQPLNAGGTELMFFDYDMTIYNKEIVPKSKTSQQLSVLDSYKLNLNGFGSYQSSKSYGDTYKSDPFKGVVSNNDTDEEFKVTYDFRRILVGRTGGYTKGNIKYMLDKGDLKFAFAYRVYVRRYTQEGINYKNKSAIAEINIFGETRRETGTDGNRWVRVNYTENDNKAYDKLNLSGSSTWKDWSGNNLIMSYYGDSYNGGPVHTEMENGVLVGRDYNGPSIRTVNLSWSKDGPWEYNPDGTPNKNWQGIDGIKDKDIGKTVYIGVTFDEPVKFNQHYDTPEELEKLKLTVQTRGRDGSSAMPLEADFLEYAPDANTSCPVMIFEYKIPDPKSDSSFRKDLYYELTHVEISDKYNSAIYKNLTDMAGNGYGRKNGSPSGSYSVSVNNRRWKNNEWVPRKTVVDLEPLIIESATITRSSDSTYEYLAKNESIIITLNYNKIRANENGVPKITLNIKDQNGEYAVPKLRRIEETRIGGSGHLRTGLCYEFAFYWWQWKRYTAEGPIRIQSISIPEGETEMDESGYTLTIPETMPVFDKNYYVDYDAPVINVGFTMVDNNIFMIKANVSDTALRGRDAAFSVKTDLDSQSPIEYQISTDGEYGPEWKTATGKSFSVNAPLVPPGGGNNKNAYVFVKLPDNDAQMSWVWADIHVTDAVGNHGYGYGGYRFDPPLDSMAPKVELERRYKTDGFSIMLKTFDNGGVMTYRYAWLDGHDADFPSAWTGEGSIGNSYKLLEYNYADNGMTGNEIYEKTLWVEVEDRAGNRTARSLNLILDNKNSEIHVERVFPEETGDIIKDMDLSAAVSFKNAVEYAHTWIEWGPEFENDGGSLFKSTAATYFNGYDRNVFRDTRTTADTTTTAAVTFTLDSDTLVWRNYNKDGIGYRYGEDDAGRVSAGEISGPIVLAICSRYHSEIEGEDRYTFEFIPFNTRYTTGNYEVQQVRFSTNRADGSRIDRVYDSFINYYRGENSPSWGYGLYYPEKPGNGVLNAINMSLPLTGAEGVSPTALNFTPLYDFAEAEFILRDDSAIGLEALKLTGEDGGTKVFLKKVTFQSDGSMEYSITGDPNTGYDYSFRFKDESKISDEILETWYLTEDMLTLADGNKRIGASLPKSNGNDRKYLLDYDFILPVDISLITPYAFDEDGNLIRYEFWIEYAWQDHYGSPNTSGLLTMFAFENRLPEIMFESVKSGGNEFGESRRAEPANISAAGEGDDVQITDNTISAHRVFFSGDDPELMLKVDMPDNAFNMLNKYSISTERISDSPGMINDPVTIAPGHNYYVSYGVSEDLGISRQSIVINGRSAECQDGSFVIDLEDLFEGIGGTLDDGETLTAYLQLVKEDIIKIESPGEIIYQPVKRYSPVYRIDIVRDETPPVISLNVSETRTTNNDVTVTIQGVMDGHIVNEGQPDEHYVMDTPDRDIEVIVSAEYEDGEIIQPENGAYIFKRNGSIVVTAKDKAGNEAEEIYQVDNIDKEPPVVTGSPVINSESGSFSINAAITGGDAADAYITFDTAYTAHLLDVSEDDIESSVNRFPAKGSETYGIFLKKEISGGDDDSIELLIYAKSGVPLSSAILHVTDTVGNVGELALPVNIDGIAPAVTNTDKIYSYGEALTFSGPVRLVNPVGSEKGYAVSHENLPIYKDGPVAVSYIDIFGRSYYEYITANIFGEAYAHDLTITPGGPTNGNVTVRIDTTGYGTAVLDGEDEYHKTIVISDNGNVKYTIIPDGIMPPMEFTIPISNIDRTPPKALYTRTVNGEESFDQEGESIITGSVTYTILGFDEDNVVMDDGQSINVTFTEPGTHTFRFTDAAGNKGELTVSELDTTFVPQMDLDISRFRLTYTMSGSGTGPVQLGRHDSDKTAPALMVTNRDISVYIQALNAAGEVIPAEMERPVGLVDGVEYYYLQNTLVFTKNTSAAVTFKTVSGSRKSITVTIPEGTIDKIPPVGTVEYVMLTRDETLPDGTLFAKGTVKACLNTEEKDIEVSGHNVRRDPEDGRYYIHFAENGSGKFYLTDKAGNTSIIMAGAYGIDITPPGITSESWYSSIAAKPGADDGTSGNSRDDVLSTITSNSIRLFFVFDELIRNVDISAYSAEDGLKIPDGMLSSYISYTHSANTLSIEFKQNCQAEISVYDLKGNKTVLFRPEDGPVTVIDKKAPTYTEGTMEVEDNIVSITYAFDEEVASANAFSGYKREHTVTFDKNGVYSLTFADRAGNVATIIVNIDQIDDESPAIFYAMKIVPESADVLYSDGAKTQPVATNGNVEIAIAAKDESGETTVQVFNQNKPGTPLTLHTPTINEGAAKSYTHAVTAEENGVYRISASDKYGNTNTVFVRISFIDKEAPSISMESTKTLYVAAGTDAAGLSRQLMEGVTAKDGREGDVTSKVTVDISGVDLSREGVYTAVYRVEDGLGNAAARERKVSVTGSVLHSLVIAGKSVPVNDVYVTAPGDISVSAPEGYTLYASEGFKTRAQMKYAPSLTGNLKAVNKGYYTILAQSGDRDAFIIYVYVY